MKKFANEFPENGTKIVIVCDDGCSSSTAFVYAQPDGSYRFLEGECGDRLPDDYVRGALWQYLPDDYALCFMEMHPDY